MVSFKTWVLRRRAAGIDTAKDRSESAKKAWATRRKKYGKNGIGQYRGRKSKNGVLSKT